MIRTDGKKIYLLDIPTGMGNVDFVTIEGEQ